MALGTGIHPFLITGGKKKKENKCKAPKPEISKLPHIFKMLLKIN